MLIDFSDNVTPKVQDLICSAVKRTLEHFPDINTDSAEVTFKIKNIKGSVGDVLKYSHNEFWIRITPGLSSSELQRTVAHEVTHVLQYLRGDDLSHKGVAYLERDYEVEAYAVEDLLYPLDET